MTTKVKPRSPSSVVVSAATEWTDYHGILELFGLRRSTGYHLSNEGLIKSVSLAEHGEKRGKRLFHVPSIREYLNSKLEKPSSGGEQDSEIASNGGQQPAAAEKSGNSLGTL
jgi:hypothetical protein